jgi:hypothetical protein
MPSPTMSCGEAQLSILGNGIFRLFGVIDLELVNQGDEPIFLTDIMGGTTDLTLFYKNGE